MLGDEAFSASILLITVTQVRKPPKTFIMAKARSMLQL